MKNLRQFLFRSKRYEDVAPDEIFMDATNLPAFDTTRLEGRIESPIRAATYKHFLWVIGAAAVIYISQLAYLQIVSYDAFAARAEENRLEHSIVIADRGRVIDRNGVVLAENTPTEEGYAERSYPLGEAAAHLVGYVTYPKKDANGFWYQDSIEGIAGAELNDNDVLRGLNGLEITETNASTDIVSGSVVRSPIEGADIVLTVDADLQRVLYDAIKTRSLESGWQGGTGAIMDIVTGELLALSSYPSYDPVVMSRGTPEEMVSEFLTGESSPLLNRPVTGLYSPGSVVKPFIALAALEERVIDPETKILSTGSITVPNPYDPDKPSVFRDWRAHGWVDMRRALAVSSDVYFYEVGGGFENQRGLGIAKIEKYMHLFGFGSPTGLDTSLEEAGVVPNPDWKAAHFDGEQWFLGNTYHTAIGQYGFQVTVLQLTRAVAALANGGYLVTPTIHVDRAPERTRLDARQENLAIVREGMRLAVTEGTAQSISVYDIAVAGKTGTAEVGAKKEYTNSVIIGFFPYDKPRYAFALLMERAKAGTLEGAPLAMRSVLEWIAANRSEMAE